MAVQMSFISKQMMEDARSPSSSFIRSWQNIAPVGVSRLHYRRESGRRAVAGAGVKLDVRIEATPEMKRFMARLDVMPAYARKEFKRMLRGAAREVVLPRLRSNIPQSDRRKRHLRATAAIMSVDTRRVIIGVGSPRLFYAAIVHAGRSGGKKGSVPPQPFFPLTFREVLTPLNNRLIRDMYNMMGWLASGRNYRRQ